LCVELKHDMEPAYSQKPNSYRLTPNPMHLHLAQGSNLLHGAFPNLPLKLNTVPGAPLEKQTAARAPESARRRGEVWQATSHMLCIKAIASLAFASDIRVAVIYSTCAPPCLRRMCSCSATGGELPVVAEGMSAQSL
jgi:hypothetical protein